MDIKQAIEMKKLLDSTITHLLNDYEKSTGLQIEGGAIERIRVSEDEHEGRPFFTSKIILS